MKRSEHLFLIPGFLTMRIGRLNLNIRTVLAANPVPKRKNKKGFTVSDTML